MWVKKQIPILINILKDNVWLRGGDLNGFRDSKPFMK